MTLQPASAASPPKEKRHPLAEPQLIPTILPVGASPNGSPSPSGSRLPQARRLSRLAKVVFISTALVFAVSSAGGAWYYFSGIGSSRKDLVLHTVGFDNLQLTIVERGALESAENSDIVCRVKAGTKGSTVATTIKWVIDDGSHVKRGQVVAELDDSGLYEQQKTEKITVDQAQAAWVQAEENYKIVDSQNQSDVKTAEIAVQLAELDLEKYLKGDYEQTKKDIEGRTKTAESDLEQYRDRAAWSDRMVKKGYQTASQAQADHSRQQSAEIALAKVHEEMRVLEDYTKPRTITDLRSKVEEAKRALERVKTQAKAKEVTANSDRLAKKSVFEQEEARYHEIEEEIKKCTLVSPQDGMVVYYISDQSRFGAARNNRSSPKESRFGKDRN